MIRYNSRTRSFSAEDTQKQIDKLEAKKIDEQIKELTENYKEELKNLQEQKKQLMNR